MAAVALASLSTTSSPANAQEATGAEEFVPQRPGQIEDPGVPRFGTSGWSTDFSISSVPFDEIVPCYHAGLWSSMLVLAATANSPLVLGKCCWQESRIGIFKQAGDAGIGIPEVMYEEGVG